MFDVDKHDLLMQVLDRHNGHYNRTKDGWQSVHCINSVGHVAGDRSPSARIHLGSGWYHCFGCGMRGDGFDVMMEMEGMRPSRVLEALQVSAPITEGEYLF